MSGSVVYLPESTQLDAIHKLFNTSIATSHILTPMTDLHFFATTPKAMEDILVAELKQLGAKNVKAALAGAYFEGSIETAYRVCLWSRIANRVLLTLGTFSVTS